MEENAEMCGTTAHLRNILREHGGMDDDDAAEVAPQLMELAARHRAACLLFTNGMREFDEAIVFETIETDLVNLLGDADAVSFNRDPRGPTTRLHLADNYSNSFAGGVTVDAPATIIGPLLEDSDWVDEVAASSEAARRFVFKVDLDERGCFRAHVERALDEKCVFELNNEHPKYEIAMEHEDTGEERTVLVDKWEVSTENEAIAIAKEREGLGDAWFIMHVGDVVEYGDLELVTDGFMRHTEDTAGLCEHLISLGILPQAATLATGYPENVKPGQSVPRPRLG